MAPLETPLDLLPYQNTILAECLNPTNSDLIIIARGLGLRRLVCSLLRIYDNSGSLVLLINCDPDEDTAIGEQLGVMGARHPGLRIVDYEMGSKRRTELYNRGGLVCVTSRILVVDMLKKDIPTEKVTGIVVMHAEKYGTVYTSPANNTSLTLTTDTDLKEGFIKAFSDQPEQFTYGMSPLKTIMKEFHEEVNKSLERRRADVVEIFPSMTPAMEEIHISLVQCMTLDLEDINVESAYFRHFDAIVRRALAPVWHRVRPATKQLVNDLGTLRSLLVFLLSYDCVALHAYLETIVASNSEANTGGKGQKRANQSPWLYTDAANVLLTSARRRCYVNIAPEHQQRLRDEAAMDEEFALLDELEGRGTGSRKKADDKRPAWLPHTMEPVLEELPKWKLLADVLKEIDESIIANSMKHCDTAPGTNTTLVMLSDNRSATLVREYLGTMDQDSEYPGRNMLMNRLKGYVYWKRELSGTKQTTKPTPGASTNTSVNSSESNPISEAMRKKDAARAEAASRRRRVRGAGTTGAAAGRSGVKKEEDSAIAGQGIIAAEADEVAEFHSLATQQGLDATGSMLSNAQALETLLAAERSQLREGEEDEYGLLEDEHTVLVRTYGDDGDDQLLSEIRPRYIVMMEPNLDFIRRVEVYRSASPGLAVRVYFMTYSKTVEEHKFLAGQRREKDAFEALIKEKGSMVLTIEDPRRGYDPNDSVIRTISSRIAGGGLREINNEPPRVVVDMREFRSTLPSILHLSQIQVVPATLTVGDYILTPDIVVERKSVPDLVSTYYKQPVLLIEFEENKSFTLQAFQDTRISARKKDRAGPNTPEIDDWDIQSKLVLLTLAFPKLRIIWSSSPYATADIFTEFKKNNKEPDPQVAVTIGANEGEEENAAVNQLAEDMLRALPGVTQKNYRSIMNRVGSLREFCKLSLRQMQEIMGDEPGKACHTFIHTTRGETYKPK
ncbi:DNA repair protein RAD1, putative [Rhizoctonia solani AG-1 IA]|uniref:DNA repair protein RAD1, putative n=1 Tax=Thanatephorus cucumeris (strain AG1-IA) TaxID=983506 RepID=L8WL03_THACA|nr:DNA repair protein RAD1, putative [Rhizoctonia solani AG-1 IA]